MIMQYMIKVHVHKELPKPLHLAFRLNFIKPSNRQMGRVIPDLLAWATYQSSILIPGDAGSLMHTHLEIYPRQR